MLRLSGWVARFLGRYRKLKARYLEAKRAALRNKRAGEKLQAALTESRASIRDNEQRILELERTAHVQSVELLLQRTVIERYQAHEEAELAAKERARILALKDSPKDETR